MTDLIVPAKTKYCSGCKTTKPINRFYKRRGRPCGYAAKCKDCRNQYHANYIKTPKGQYSLKESSRKYWLKYGKEYSKDPAKRAIKNAAVAKYHKSEKGIQKRRDHHLRSKYGITIAEYNAIFESQNKSCAICGYQGENKNFHLDHNHQTGKVRGILCNPCNGALGLMRDNIETLEKAIQYLRDESNQ